MKNPCDECLIKVNCTEVCNEKKNFITLVNVGLNQNISTYNYKNSLYFVYFELAHKNRLDCRKIDLRKLGRVNVK